jgi:hypothetical protein
VANSAAKKERRELGNIPTPDHQWPAYSNNTCSSVGGDLQRVKSTASGY